MVYLSSIPHNSPDWNEIMAYEGCTARRRPGRHGTPGLLRRNKAPGNPDAPSHAYAGEVPFLHLMRAGTGGIPSAYSRRSA